jgi:uncharacterized protein YciI/uncharacterized protein YndB with AHSA1/START domain
MTRRPAPIRREIRIAAPVDATFAAFTERIGAWWPLGDLSVFGDGTVAFEDGRLVERAGAREAVWAEVVEWDPPRGLGMSWHPGSGPDRATDVRVTFTPDGADTVVAIEHRGWERLADPAAAAAEYDHGWPDVLARFAASVHPAGHPQEQDHGHSGTDEDRWYALVHRRGPSVPEGVSIFATDAFREHVAFLGRLHDHGLLVAAGPLADEDGTGMTVVRVRPEHGEVDVATLASHDDRCVAEGFLTVSVRPWSVMWADV